MKKIYLCTIILLGIIFSTKAQESISNNAIGLRFGNNYGLGVEISYQRKLSTTNRLELGVEWSNSNNTEALKLTGIYQWYWKIEKGLFWYAGGGAGLGSWNTDDNYNNGYASDNGIFLVVIGDVGIEYNFKEIPIQLSLDARPEIVFNNYQKHDFGVNMGIGVRYKF